MFVVRLREKYHPDFIDDTREQITKNIRQRLDVFLDLFDKGMIDNQSVDMENAKNLIKLMDAVVIKLNGGTDDDLAILDNPDTIDDDCRSSKGKVSLFENARGLSDAPCLYYCCFLLHVRHLGPRVVQRAKVKSPIFILVKKWIPANLPNRSVPKQSLPNLNLNRRRSAMIGLV